MSSSSFMASVASSGSATPWPPLAAPETATLALGASTVLSVAVTVTAPVLVVAPAAMVRSALSPSAAGAPSGRLTVIVVSALEARSRLAVTVLTLPLPLSSIVEGDKFSVATGVASSSTRVIVAGLTVKPVSVPKTLMVSSTSSISSSIGVRVKVPEPLAANSRMLTSKASTCS